jgi:hypothetical protein
MVRISAFEDRMGEIKAVLESMQDHVRAGGDPAVWYPARDRLLAKLEELRAEAEKL